MSIEDSDRDDRTLFIGGLSEKMTEKLLYELFFQAGPIERVSIPKDKDGKNKTFGFVTYKHLIAVPYALNIFSGTKLFGREITLKNRNSNSNRNSLTNQYQQQSPNVNPLMQLNSHSSLTQSNPLLNAINLTNDFVPNNMNMIPSSQPAFVNIGHQLLQQQFLNMAAAQEYAKQLYNFNSNDAFPSTRVDNIGSQRDNLVDRNRRRREEERSRPYERRRSRERDRSRSRSPMSRNRDRNSRRDAGYHRWNYRK